MQSFVTLILVVHMITTLGYTVKFDKFSNSLR